MKYQKDIKEWTLDFSILIIKLSTALKKTDIDYDVIGQIRRSGTSVGANIREAKSSVSRKELIKFYAIALKSANETDFWLEIITNGYDYRSELLTEIWEELKQIEKVIASIIIKLKKEKLEVQPFKF
ncbi:MAG: four helix bundle protein [Bacteroidia bacterium]|nr:four helix bundle protein [Bacteroidia bacterium]